MKDYKSRIISAVEMACVSDVVNLTCDRIEALAGGHGMVNMAIFSVANVITEELQRGSSLDVKFANERRVPVDDIMEKAVKAAKRAGADGANAALITACVMYLAGSPAQVGIPAGNRKLGATARMLAGVDRCGVSAVPTGKMNNKISAFPAVLAINQALLDGTLSPISGRNLPKYVGGGCLFGHSALGEDYIWPAMAENGARIGTQAMLDAMAGASINPQPFVAAVLGAAAILEIIHPDAEVPESEGLYGRTSSAVIVGRTAAKVAGLPEKLHMRLTGQDYDTAQLVGDVGLILKDIGGPTVIGMMAFVEIFSVFRERLCGGSGGPHNAPLGHMTCFAVSAMIALADKTADQRALAKELVRDRVEGNVHPECSLFCINIVARKAAELRNGPVTRFLIGATEPARAKAIHDRAFYAYNALESGRDVTGIAKELDDQRVATVEKHTGYWFKYLTGEEVSIKFLKLGKAARRTSKLVQKYFSFDPYFDIEVTVNGKTALMKNYAADVIPKVCIGEYEDVAWAVPYAASAASDIMLAGCNLLNAVVPAAVAAAMGKCQPEDAAAQAEQGAYITCGIPGGKAAATKIARLAVEIVDFADYDYTL